ncbi:MAG: hypothetical protein JNK19_11155 [Tabrizicola sp.]|nr:hypothetical protein [Tabrizicola sp.]
MINLDPGASARIGGRDKPDTAPYTRQEPLPANVSMTILALGLLSRGFPSVGSASDRRRGRTHLCGWSGISDPYQAEGVTPRDLLP